MKAILRPTLVLGFFLFSFSILAQIELFDPSRISGGDVNNDTMLVTGLSSDWELEQSLWVVNSGSQDITLLCKKTEIDVVTGTENIACWKYCPANYDVAGANPISFISLAGVNMTETLMPLDTNKSFSSHYKPQGNAGASMIRYEWYDINDTTTSLATVNVVFDALPASINEFNQTDNIDLFLDAQLRQVQINLDGATSSSKYSFQIFDLIGKINLVRPINPQIEKQYISLEKINSGLYVFAVLKDEQVIFTKKIVVN